MNPLWIVMTVVMGSALAETYTQNDWDMLARVAVIIALFVGGLALHLKRDCR